MELAGRIALDDTDDPPESARAAASTPSPRRAPSPPEMPPDPASEASPSRPRLHVRLLSNRLVQFSLVAAALFAIAPRAQPPSRIELRHEAIDKLHGAAAAKAGRVTLSREDAAAVDRRAIEDEILFREGSRLGLDQADGVVRNRVIQKTLFFAEELADASRAPDVAAMRAYFEAHALDFAKPARVRLQHVFARTAEALPPRPANGEGVAGHPLALGEPGPVPAEMSGDERALTEAFGAEAAQRIAALPEGTWEGPIPSPFGFHVVKVIAHEGARAPRFEEVRARVLERMSLERRERAVAAFLEKAFARYEVSLDGERVPVLEAPHRVAVRSATSGED